MSAPASTAALLRRLERGLLLHLLDHIEELRAELDQATAERDAARRDADHAYDCAESWRQDAMRLTDEITDAGGTVGLTVRGEIVVIDTPAAKPSAVAS